jgi:50S ribosomal protein L16 3-hydroxylase
LMDITQPLALLGGLSPQTFMKRHWQKKPLLIRQAVPALSACGAKPLLDRAALFDLAASDAVESRLVTHFAAGSKSKATTRLASRGQGVKTWQLAQGPFARRTLPALKQPDWSLLVQGVDLHHEGIRALMDKFRFVPDARLDDVMVSYATPGGGVGPHFDSYDVFLLQAQGRRRWQIGRQKNLDLEPGVPLKILANFEPEQTFVLEPGDMLYLPPRYAHDGVALDECMTWSIGFRAPGEGELARELLLRLADDALDEVGPALYRDANQGAVQSAAQIPADLQAFAQAAVRRAMQDPAVLQRALGEYLTEPKSNVWFDEGAQLPLTPAAKSGTLKLDRRTKMMFDERHIFINGESFLAGGRDAQLMQRLANDRCLLATDVRRASSGAQSLLQDWIDAGWMHGL